MKKILWVFYILVLLIPLVTWYRGADLSGDLRYELVRFSGLMAFTLMFLQIGIGAFMNKLRPIMGYKFLSFHIIQGLIAFTLAVLHPLGLVLMVGLQKVINLGGYASWGRMALFLLIVSLVAGLLRTKPFMQKYWRWIHRLNYVIFAMVYWHSWNMGMDTRLFPMVILYYLAPVVLIISVANKVFPYLKSIQTNKAE